MLGLRPKPQTRRLRRLVSYRFTLILFFFNCPPFKKGGAKTTVLSESHRLRRFDSSKSLVLTNQHPHPIQLITFFNDNFLKKVNKNNEQVV